MARLRLQVDQVDSPLGRLTLVVSPRGVCALDFDDCIARLERFLRARYGEVELERATDPNGYAGRLRAYFLGELTALDGIAVDPGGTSFQMMVWAALRRIPPGRTAAYGELAALLGRPGAARAVGGANARNPVGLVIPCHRLVGADGSPTGYAGGIERKRWLLRHERQYSSAHPGQLVASGSAGTHLVE